MSRMLALAGRIRQGMLNSAYTADLLLAWLAVVAGIWLLIPGWAVLRFRRIAEQMVIVWPIWTWGILFLAIGVISIFGVIAKRPGAVVFGHLIGVGLWLFLGGLMTFRAFVPPMEGFFCVVVGNFCLIRLAQIPKD